MGVKLFCFERQVWSEIVCRKWSAERRSKFAARQIILGSDLSHRIYFSLIILKNIN